MMLAGSILDIAMLWAMIGGGVALVFLTIGIDRIDEDARGAYVFRLLVVPGTVLLWPLVLWRWWVLETGRGVWASRHAPPRRAHTKAAVLMAIVIPVILIAALALRQTWPADFAPQRLSPPAEAAQ